MPLKKLILSGLAQLSYIVWKRNYTHYFVIFNYHQVTRDFDPRYHSAETWTCLDFFERQLRWIQHHFEVLPLPDAMASHRSGELSRVTAALTFDDGDISVERFVLPLLKKLGLPAAFFINTGHLALRRQYWFRVLTYLTNSTNDKERAMLTADCYSRALQLKSTRDPHFYRTTRAEIEKIGAGIEYDDRWCVSEQWLAGLDGEQFHVGLHGHEHQRFSMMPVEWQVENLRRNVEILSQFRAYRPIFALPFGRPIDFATETIRIALEEKLEILMANGGVNLHPDVSWKRIPADQRPVKQLVLREALGW